jgi:(E)-4-hydroxy-3-methylbut-2-enyl-diphosphate synthase
METVRAYRQLAALVPYPLHLGVTEAGPPITGAIRNALGIGLLLQEGIGDTLRVSLSGDPVLEVQAGKEILRSLHLAPPGPTVISCPTCGRTTLDVPGIATRISAVLDTVKRPVKVAIMGCVVNGPGECREADVGIAGGGDKVLVYRAGEFSHAVPVVEAYDALLREIERVVADAPAR